MNPQSPIASATVVTTRAPAKMSSAPAASAMASACGKERGRTSTRSVKRHVLHGARHRADVARMAGIDEDDANEGRHALLF